MADNKPDHEHLLELIDCARIKFEQCLSSESNRCIMAKTPDYLMKFTAANVYAGIVFNNINVLKKDKTDNRRMGQAVAFLEKLLEEKHFLSKKRGQVYDALIRIYRQRKDFSKALSTFQKAGEDELISHVIQFTLLAQMKPLLTQKAVPEQIKSKLSAVYHIQQILFNCNSIETMTVSAKSTPSDKPNRKKVYVTETEDCTLYQSVEELVVNHFKKDGWYGVHDEGSLLKNIIFACFWDIIFSSPTLENDEMSVFVSKCQMRPLDWGSRQFYLRRQSAIKQRLKEIETSDWSGVNARVVKCFTNHGGESFNKSIWKWIKSENLMNIEAFLMCLSTKFIASVAEWLLKDFGTYSSGFPDCTLWHRTNKQCIFVEVKSPSDTLAKHQEFWLTKIEEFGGNSRICHVREIASCSARLNS
ncbi:fanconi-associated nuclease 1 [Nilaparvata lugens]|uniref:fanconi-associated nuclease 1 n=1 Tax=Nilaparvata lugens TaxID=108931 RepID=UPI00193DB80F|nr:fanconi-associated nuclease 1 [Nilaparvata lugens]